MREVYREGFGVGREGDRVTVTAARDGRAGCVSVIVQRGDLGTTLTLNVADARQLANRLNDAAIKIAKALGLKLDRLAECE